MKKSRILILGIVAGVAVAAPQLARADTTAPGIIGSPHDFTTSTNFWVNGTTYVPNNNVCEECHTLHKAPSTSSPWNSAGPLWAHEGPSAPATYTPFTSPQLTADGYPNGGTPGWASLACLSCHDGVLAVNEVNGKVPSTPITMSSVASFAVITAGAASATDISGTHPIGINYNTVQAADPGLNAATTVIAANAGANNGETIGQLLLFNESSLGGGSAMLECASCHDIHQQRGVSGVASASPLGHRDSVVIGTTTSTQTLCTACHIK